MRSTPVWTELFMRSTFSISGKRKDASTVVIFFSPVIFDLDLENIEKKTLNLNKHDIVSNSFFGHFGERKHRFVVSRHIKEFLQCIDSLQHILFARKIV